MGGIASELLLPRFVGRELIPLSVYAYPSGDRVCGLIILSDAVRNSVYVPFGRRGTRIVMRGSPGRYLLPHA